MPWLRLLLMWIDDDFDLGSLASIDKGLFAKCCSDVKERFVDMSRKRRRNM